MANFYVMESSPEFAKPSPGDVLDTVIGAAGGKALPGKLGVVQAVLSVVAAPRHNVHPALHWTKVGLGAVGLLRAYQKANDPKASEERKEPIAEWFRANDMKIPDGLNRVSGMILSSSEGMKHEDIRVGADNTSSDWIRIYTLKSGIRYAFRMWKGNAYYGNSDIGDGPYVEQKRHAAFIQTIGDVVWAHGGGGDLQLTVLRNSTNTASAFSLSSIGDPETYIGSGDAASVDRSVDRCRKFQARGISRNLLFYGPPGTGKTTLARSIARGIGNGRTLRVEANALELAGVGAVLGFIRILRPRVVLFDDMDRCMGAVTELLHAFEQGGSLSEVGSMMIGTINVVESVDPALLRPGRFDEVIDVNEPNDEHRARIVSHYVSVYGLDKDIAEPLTEMTAGFSPADIREVIRSVAVVGLDHLEAEVGRVKRQRPLYAGDACRRFSRGAAADNWPPPVPAKF